MPGSGRTIFIAGAGIAGLTLALALAKYGARIVLFEKTAQVSAFGAGLQIGPNGRRVLDRLGLDEAIAARSFEPEGIDVLRHGRTAPLVTLELGEAARARFASPYAVLHRADLVDILHRACKRFANIEIVFSAGPITTEADGDGVRVNVTDGAGRSHGGRGFALVGADGVHSGVRTRLIGGEPARFTGRLAWRTLVAPGAVADVFRGEATTLVLAPGFHLVAYPLPHRDRVNLALFSRVAALTGDEEWRKGRPVLPAGTRLEPPLARLFERIGPDWTAWPLHCVTETRWHRGAVGLIGDAAHAMMPFQAQGAAMAIEDAAVLAPLLIASDRAEDAFARFSALRRARVERVAAVSARNARIFHMRWPLSMARDLVMRLEGPRGHFRRLGWLYDHDPGV